MTLRWSRKRGVQSQKFVEPAIQAGIRTSHPWFGRFAAGDRHQRDEPARDEEPDREEQLLGHAANVDAPDARVEILVELADREPPEQIASPQSRKPITVVSVAASTLLEVVPNRSWTRFGSSRRASCR